jgi:hypothetical protein
MPLSDETMAINAGKVIVVNAGGTDFEYVDTPTNSGNPTELDGGTASATGQETIDGGSA